MVLVASPLGMDLARFFLEFLDKLAMKIKFNTKVSYSKENKAFKYNYR
jgi:hypothetical protein